MNRRSLVLLALTLVVVFASSVSATDDNKVQSSLIVSTEWVAKHLNDDSFVLLQVGDKDEYLAVHIPAAGVKQRDTIATYCHIGQQASLLYFVARYLGYEAHLYDGSFEDWSHRPELPIERSEKEKSETITAKP